MDITYNISIDSVTQGPDGQEIPADRLCINSEDFLLVYVEAKLPSASSPKGEYRKTGRGDETAQALSDPTWINGKYRFSVIHCVLSRQSHYSFRFADNRAAPTYEHS